MLLLYYSGIGCNKTDCPGEPDCNNRGDCIKADIPYCGNCQTGWTGLACEAPCINGTQSKKDARICECDACFTGVKCDSLCSGVINATCVNQTCNCGFQGWRGSLCEKKGCPGWDTDCTGHGTCNSATGVCNCNEGWSGRGCEIPNCPGTPDCSGHGTCNRAATPYCSCNVGWMGAACNVPCVKGTPSRNNQGDYICNCETCYSGVSCDEECSGRGNCTNNTCDCGFDGWRGNLCQLRGCPGWKTDCTGHGSCLVDGTCFCNPGWTGKGCEIPRCAGGGNCNGHGVCDGVHYNPPVCVSCDPGYFGNDCGTRCYNGTVVSTPKGRECKCDSCHTGVYCNKECSSHGKCVKDKCQCDRGYRGDKCETIGCPGDGSDCSGHGVCIGILQTCNCFNGWKGDGCNIPNCPGIPDCNGKGECDGSVNPPRCVNCTNNTMGSACELPCIHGEEDPPNSAICKCRPCYRGLACDLECSGHGTCNNSKCVCKAGRKGDLCQSIDCPGEPDCSGHGVCLQEQGAITPRCLCNQGFDGLDCSKLVCPGSPMCNDRGNCTLVKNVPKCVCRHGFMGLSCEKCQTRFTGSECERCVTNYIGWKDSCSVYCVHGMATIPNGDICGCYNDNVNGHWNGSTCEQCIRGWALPDCKVCDTSHVGQNCKIKCVKANADYRDVRDGLWDNKPIKPVLTCLYKLKSGAIYAWFGYENKNAHNVYISAGPDNRFSRPDLVLDPGGQAGFVRKANKQVSGNLVPLVSENLGQPTKFEPGKYDRIFKIRYVMMDCNYYWFILSLTVDCFWYLSPRIRWTFLLSTLSKTFWHKVLG